MRNAVIAACLLLAVIASAWGIPWLDTVLCAVVGIAVLAEIFDLDGGSL